MNQIAPAKFYTKIYEQVILDYHLTEKNKNPYFLNSIEYQIYQKNWIDTIQWHLEDLTRDSKITGIQMISLKQEIDSSNQERNNIVEIIDDLMFDILYQDLIFDEGLPLNSETPGWILDRLSILELKIFHMSEQVDRVGVLNEHVIRCKNKLQILKSQKCDLLLSFDTLINEILTSKRRYKVYKQMKMYNDPTLNPILYKK